MKNLKRKVVGSAFFIALLFAFMMKADAQNGEFGIRFMPTFSSFEMQTSSGNTVQGQVTLGYGVGAVLGYNFSEHVGVQVEGIYSTLSQKYKEQDIEHRIKLKYFNIPLLLSLNTGKTKAVNFNVVVGPQIGISMGSSLSSSGGDVNTTQPVLAVKKGDLGFAYGAGIDFGINPLNTVRIGLGFRGVYGLFDISDNNTMVATDSYYILDRTHIKSNAGYIGISFLF